jgi:transposase-like protein
MKRGTAADHFSGRVIADETWFGGKPANRHGHKPKEHMPGEHEKTTIMALISRETGEVRSRVVPNVRRETLRRAISEEVDMPNTHLHTDALRTYQLIAAELGGHSFVKHEHREYVRGDVTTNQAETYFSQLKRSLDGTHHHVSKEHLERYLAEFDFRYTTCKRTDAERMAQIVADPRAAPGLSTSWLGVAARSFSSSSTPPTRLCREDRPSLMRRTTGLPLPPAERPAVLA